MGRKFSEEEIEQGFYTDDSIDVICMACGEHSSLDISIDEDGEDVERLSSCCGSGFSDY